jgi:predicted AlkP superfamily phosphohydrolase/phosphomutase
MKKFFGRRNAPRKLVVMGLDCASPDLIFETFTEDLPNLRTLMSGAQWGKLRSSIPCITVPAWSSMLSSRDPGVLGIYGFRNRANRSYDELTVADSTAVQVPRVWDYLGAAGKTSLVMNVPQTYPVRPLQGHLVGGFLTPNSGAQFTYPAIFKQEILRNFPNYDFDVRNFRNIERGELLQRIIDLTEIQYSAFEHALKQKTWDFAIHVNIGLDRIHHAFWRYHDPLHRLHEPGSRFQHAIRDYYRQVDHWVGRIRAAIPDDTIMMVVSDHGVTRMDGAIAINEWLIRNGWLSLKSQPDNIQKLTPEQIDWSRTRAWSTGGYYGRIFLNIEGREANGIIKQAELAETRAALAAQLLKIPDHTGNPLQNQVFEPQQIYQQVNGFAPDLLVYFGDLHWRTVGGVGYEQPYTLENDTGPDDANHAEDGLYILHDPLHPSKNRSQQQHLMDVAPTILRQLDVRVPPELQGRIIEL